MQSRPTVFVIDDDPDARRFVRRVVASIDSRAEVFATAEDFLAEWGPTSDATLRCVPTPACLVLELDLPGMDGLQLQEQLARHCCDLPLIFVAARGPVWAAVQATKRGAWDFLEKPLQMPQLIHAVRTAWADDRRRRSDAARKRETQRRLATLTQRERQVLEKLLLREPLKRIASQLGTSPHTVRNQRATILRKMEAQDDAELVAMLLFSRGRGDRVDG